MFIYLYLFVCIYLSVYDVHVVPSEARRGQGSLALELQVVVSHLMWVLGTKPKGSVRVESSLNF